MEGEVSSICITGNQCSNALFPISVIQCNKEFHGIYDRWSLDNSPQKYFTLKVKFKPIHVFVFVWAASFQLYHYLRRVPIVTRDYNGFIVALMNILKKVSHENNFFSI